MKVESHVTSISWIPSETVTGITETLFASGLSHYDEPLPDHFDSIDELARADRFRFANHLSGWAEFEDGHPVRWEQGGGCVMGSTTARIGKVGLTVAGFAMPDLRGEPEIGADFVRFHQTAGGRTGYPLPHPIPSPPFVRLQAPTVWTTLSLTLRADGTAQFELTGASPFPRHWIYDADDTLARKAGLAQYKEWLTQKSYGQTPWGHEDSAVLVTDAESGLERSLSGLIMRGGKAPTLHEFEPDSVLMRQGDPSDTIALLLDGVVTVTVDGEPVAELGPGVVIGERAALESGLRSATVTAVTHVRIAEVAAASLDQSVREQLVLLHRREAEAKTEQ